MPETLPRFAPPHEMRLGDTEEDYYRLGLQPEDAAPTVPAEGGGRASADNAVKREKAAKGGEGK